MRKINIFTRVVILAILTSNAKANITGQIDVSLEVSSGCIVENATQNGNMNKFGVLDFGKTAPTWTNTLTGEVESTGAGGDISVKCDPDVAGFNVAINGGQRGDRTLSNSTDNIAYEIYQDASLTKTYPINYPVLFANSAESVKVPIFGGIKANNTAVSKGNYTDVLLVTVSF